MSLLRKFCSRRSEAIRFASSGGEFEYREVFGARIVRIFPLHSETRVKLPYSSPPLFLEKSVTRNEAVGVDGNGARCEAARSGNAARCFQCEASRVGRNDTPDAGSAGHGPWPLSRRPGGYVSRQTREKEERATCNSSCKRGRRDVTRSLVVMGRLNRGGLASLAISRLEPSCFIATMAEEKNKTGCNLNRMFKILNRRLMV